LPGLALKFGRRMNNGRITRLNNENLFVMIGGRRKAGG
jgi:hypothetical protein